jgi:SAM-dependent methyltransferase
VAFEDVMATVGRLSASADALAAIGAYLALSEDGAHGDARTKEALVDVIQAAGIRDIDALQPQERAMALNLVRLFFHLSQELLEDPFRPAGWSYTDPVVLEGMGRGSSMLPAMMSGSIPELGALTSFLDVGSGVGWLAIAAATVWPAATVVGLDIWDPAIERAREHVAEAGLEERITIRKQDVTSLDDVESYDCAWLPTFFFSHQQLKEAAARVVDALKPGGHLVLGRFDPVPDPLAQATSVLRTVRGGGEPLDLDDAINVLREAGCTDVRAVERTWNLPVAFVVGRKRS